MVHCVLTNRHTQIEHEAPVSSKHDTGPLQPLQWCSVDKESSKFDYKTDLVIS